MLKINVSKTFDLCVIILIYEVKSLFYFKYRKKAINILSSFGSQVEIIIAVYFF